jgi:threonine dehydrogenase-like Zn-dependent dehydrogenase
MLQSFLDTAGNLYVENNPIPSPHPGEVLVRISNAGICGSDMHLFKKGHGLEIPLTLGHEATGTIVGIGLGVDKERIGNRVVIEPNIPCGTCPECNRKMGSICRNKRIIGVSENGCFSEYFVIPEAFAHRIPEGFDANDAVTIEPTAVAYAALRRSGIKPGETIAIIGLGAIGMLLTHIATSFRIRVLAVDPEAEKREKAAKMGAVVFNSEQGNHLEADFSAAGVCAVFECAGAPKSAALAIEAAPRGALVMVLGLSDIPTPIIPRHLVRKGIRIFPSLIYDHPTDFSNVIDLIKKEIIKPGFIIERTFSLEEVAKAMAYALSGKAIKVRIKIFQS